MPDYLLTNNLSIINPEFCGEYDSVTRSHIIFWGVEREKGAGSVAC